MVADRKRKLKELFDIVTLREQTYTTEMLLKELGEIGYAIRVQSAPDTKLLSVQIIDIALNAVAATGIPKKDHLNSIGGALECAIFTLYHDNVMTKEKLIEELQHVIKTDKDPESAHATVDALLLEYISDPQIEELVAKVTTWYA